jgi:hypothetical protein
MEIDEGMDSHQAEKEWQQRKETTRMDKRNGKEKWRNNRPGGYIYTERFNVTSHKYFIIDLPKRRRR